MPRASIEKEIGQHRRVAKLGDVVMAFLHRLFYLGCVPLLLTPFGQAQAPSETETSSANSSPGGWLGKEDPQAVAWRAYDAMLAHDESAISELVSLAARWQPLSPQPVSADSPTRQFTMMQKEERDAMTVVLDALIQLNAPVPAGALHKLAPDFQNAVAVILARMPAEQSGPLSQELFRSPKAAYTLQYVSAAVLALHPPSGFAGKLLGGIRVQARELVVVPGTGTGFGVSRGDCFQPSEPERDDWPKIGQYKLSLQPSEGASLLVGGAEPLYVSRMEASRYLGSSCGTLGGFYLGPEERRGFIAEMLGVARDAIPWETDVQRDIEFTSIGQFTGGLLAFIEEQQQMYRETAKALQARGFLAASEVSQSLPLMELDLTDARCTGSDDGDSDDDKDSHEKCEHNIEPILRDAIKLPARVKWSE
jgi:hypothetical protein